MKSVKKSVLVSYSAQQMYDLVERIEAYPEFLPWCAAAVVLERTADVTTARLDISYHGVRAHFTTANHNSPPDKIVVSLKDGPFRRLDGTWGFVSLTPTACKVELDLCYEFSNAALSVVVGPIFNHIANTLVDAFVARAEQTYGSAT